MARKVWVVALGAGAVLLSLEGTAEASGQGAMALVLMAIPSTVAFFFGFLGFGLLLVDEKHRRLFVALYLACLVGAKLLPSWVPDVAVFAVASLPVLFALWDRGGWKALIAAALLAPLLFWAHVWLSMRALAVSPWLIPLVAALPLLPFVAACWQSARKRLALAAVPVFLVGAYLYFAIAIGLS